MSEEVKGEMGFDNPEKNDKQDSEIITKEETMFKIGPDGKAIPEKYPIKIYDRNIDKELIEETLTLIEVQKKQKAIQKVLKNLKEEQNTEFTKLKDKLEKETDPKEKEKLQKELNQKEQAKNIEEIKTKINSNVIEDGIAESKEIIQHLKQEKANTTVTKYAEIMPCNTSEAYLAFEKGKTIEGKDTDDWVADLIVNKVKTPKYTIEEAKRLIPDIKIAYKEAIMESSNYKSQSYRDIFTLKKLEEKPLTQKKG